MMEEDGEVEDGEDTYEFEDPKAYFGLVAFLFLPGFPYPGRCLRNLRRQRWNYQLSLTH